MLTFRFYFAYLNSATSADYFRVRVVGNNGQAQTVYVRGGEFGAMFPARGRRGR